MARTNDPNSATAQFFINVNNNDSLNYPQPDGHGYAVFGKVTKGMHVVNRIKMVKTGNIGYHQNVPMDTVFIKSIRRVGGETPAAAPAPEKAATPAVKKKTAKKKKK
jgi:peptidyl-prolyl cis-trans isomerase A (cyclophilin A)